MSKGTNINEVISKLEEQNELLAKWRKHYELEKTIIEKIVNRRKDLNITQQELSKLTGLKQPAIARIEKQVNSPTLSTLITIIDELDLKFELVSKDEYSFINEHFQEIYSDILGKINECKDFIINKGEIIRGGNRQYENSEYSVKSGINHFA